MRTFEDAAAMSANEPKRQVGLTAHRTVMSASGEKIHLDNRQGAPTRQNVVGDARIRSALLSRLISL
jgi:hypothetical protein